MQKMQIMYEYVKLFEIFPQFANNGEKCFLNEQCHEIFDLRPPWLPDSLAKAFFEFCFEFAEI
jgi:hypothetical protein